MSNFEGYAFYVNIFLPKGNQPEKNTLFQADFSVHNLVNHYKEYFFKSGRVLIPSSITCCTCLSSAPSIGNLGLRT